MKAAPLVLASLLFLSSLPLLAVSQATTTPATALTLTVYPDGSVGVGANSTTTSMQTPGTEPTGYLNVRVRQAGNVTTTILNGSLSLPQAMLKVSPYNYSETISASGSYAGGRSQGSITVQVVPGFSSPLTSMKFGYNGNATSISAVGNATIEYGTYEVESQPVVLNSTTIARYISLLQEEGANSSALDQYFATLPSANLTVKSLTITGTYGQSSAAIDGELQVKGNMTAIPGALASYYSCRLDQSSAGCGANSSAYGPAYSSFQSYSYTAAYSAGNMGFGAELVSNQSLTSAKAVRSIAGVENITGSESEFINTTRIDSSNLSINGTEKQMASGLLVEEFVAGGVTLYPKVQLTAGSFNESGLFNFLGTSQANGTSAETVTVVGGENAEGSVSIGVPAGVPSPSSTTQNSATWINVTLGSLAGLKFTVSSSTQTTSSTTTRSSTTESMASSTATSSSSTTSFSSASSRQSTSFASSTSTSQTVVTTSSASTTSSGSTTTYFAIGGAVAIVLVAATLFFVRSRGHRAVAPPQPTQP